MNVFKYKVLVLLSEVENIKPKEEIWYDCVLSRIDEYLNEYNRKLDFVCDNLLKLGTDILVKSINQRSKKHD